LQINGDPSLGFVLDLADETLVVIREVNGVAAQWASPSGKFLKAYDAILSVNGDQVDSKDISTKLKTTGAKSIGLGIARPTLVEVVLKKPGDLGITINYKKSSMGIWIATLKDGLVMQWNKDHPDKAIKPHDRIVTVNGKGGHSAVLVEMLRDQSETVTLQVMRYPKVA